MVRSVCFNYLYCLFIFQGAIVHPTTRSVCYRLCLVFVHVKGTSSRPKILFPFLGVEYEYACEGIMSLYVCVHVYICLYNVCVYMYMNVYIYREMCMYILYIHTEHFTQLFTLCTSILISNNSSI